jgi:hypothetical protein
MELRLSNQVLPIVEIGPTFVTLEAPIELPPGSAKLWFSIDGREREWEVRLPNGITAESRRVEIAAA